jgi:hypothetical protein
MAKVDIRVARFRDCLLWAGILKITEVAHILGYFFHCLDHASILTKNVFGYIWAIFFIKLIRSPWLTSRLIHIFEATKFRQITFSPSRLRETFFVILFNFKKCFYEKNLVGA